MAHGEFTIILAQIASENDQLSHAIQSKLVAFSGLYVLATAVIGDPADEGVEDDRPPPVPTA